MVVGDSLRGKDFFRGVKRDFCPVMLDRHREKPTVYVEIGCWNGGSAEFMARDVLTNPASKGYGIDPYSEMRRWNTGRVDHSHEEMEEIMAQSHRRLKGFRQWRWIRKTSSDALTHWNRLADGEGIDALYIDGRHEAFHVVSDFVLAWPWLNVGATVVFDDWGIGTRKKFPHVPEAVDAIEKTFGNLLAPLTQYRHKDSQAYFEVRAKDIDEEWWKWVSESNANMLMNDAASI